MAGERIRQFFQKLRQDKQADLPEGLSDDFPTQDIVQPDTDNFADASMYDVIRTGKPLNVVIRDGKVIEAEVDMVQQNEGVSKKD